MARRCSRCKRKNTSRKKTCFQCRSALKKKRIREALAVKNPNTQHPSIA